MKFPETEIIQWLSTCSFLPGSFDKRFVANVNAHASEVTQITNYQKKQRTSLYSLLHKYRNQIGIEKHKKFCKVCNHA